MGSVINKKTRYIFKYAVILLLTFCMLFNSTVVMALNTSDLAGATGLTSSQWGDITKLTTDNGAVLNWNNFNTSNGQSVQFIQPGAESAVLNRIISGEVTQFNGALLANGRVFIVNPAGVYFGGTATVNVNQLVAASLSISDEDFEGMLEDVSNLMIFNGASGGNVTNDGTITAEKVYLIGKNVINNGNINCPAGTVIMAAGDGVYLTQDGSSIFIEINNTESNISNNGTIGADNGEIILAAGDMFASAIANTGTLSASGGKITAKATTIENSGNMNVNNSVGDGGSINLKATEELTLKSSSVITANAGINNDGANGGQVTAKSRGSIIVEEGAEFQVKGGSYTDPTLVDPEATFNGGEVDIIGESVYVYGGSVDASTTAVATTEITPEDGRWVIDAPVLSIAEGAIPADNPEAVENTIYEEWIESQSQDGTNLDLLAHSAAEGIVITVEPMDELTLDKGDLALHTKYNTGGIEFIEGTGGDRTPINSTGGGNIYILAGAGGIITGDITTGLPSSDKTNEPGKIRLFTNNLGTITTGNLQVKGGSYDEVSIISCGDLTINGDIETSTNQVDNDTKEVGQARTCLGSVNGSVTINGTVTVDAHGKSYTTADIHIDAGQNITINLGGGQITAYSKTSENGPANSTINLHAGRKIEGAGTITINGTTTDKVYSYSKAGGGSNSVTLTSTGDSDVDLTGTKGNAYGLINIDSDRTEDCIDCPTPPDIDPPITPTDPVGIDDLSSTPKQDSVSIDVLDNDTGTTELYILLTSKTTLKGGSVKLNAYGQITYTPPQDLSSLSFNSSGEATDTFTYQAIDETGLVSGVITVTVVLTNNIPLANADSAETLKYDGLPVNVLNNDTDADELDQLSVLLSSGTSALGGTVTLNSDGTVNYTPPTDLSGITFDENGNATDTFTYSASDSYNESPSQQVTITLVNNIPVAENDSAEISKNSISSVINVLDNDTDIDLLDQLEVYSTSGTSTLGGTVTINPDGTLTYELPETLTFDENGQAVDTFTYRITDQYNNSTYQTVTITLINNLPITNTDIAETNQNQPVTGNVLTNDIDIDNDTLDVVLDGMPPQHGTIVLNEDGTYTYTPENGYIGEDSFSYIASDGFNETYGVVIISVGFVAAAPLPNEEEMKLSGCPALMEWAAQEIGIEKSQTQIWIANTLANARDIQPCDACANLKQAAEVLIDTDGTYLASLAQIVNEYASADAPPSEEQMAMISNAIANNDEAGNAYAMAGEYLDALVAYIGIVNNNLNLSSDDSTTVAVEKYILPIAETGNTAVATYLISRVTTPAG